MDVAITGASGLIGTALRDALEREGHRVIRFVRRPVPGDERVVLWDPPNRRVEPDHLDRLDGLDAVVHLAGEGIGDKRWSDAQRARIVDSRVDGTTLLAETLAALDHKPSVLVSGSAIGVYGDAGDAVVTESSTPGTGFLAELCQRWEAAATPAAAAGIRVACIRTGIVLSPAGGVLPRLRTLFRFGLGGRLGSGRQWMSWITIDDEIAAIRWIIDHDIAGPVNLTAPAPVTNAELTKVLAAALHRPAILPIPAFGPKLLLGRDLAQHLLFDSQRVEPRVLLDSGFAFSSTDLASAIEGLLSA